MWKILNLVLLSCLLIVWAGAASSHVTLPVYGNPPIGYVFVVLAFVLMSAAIWSRYGLVPFPVHSGAVALAIGVSMIARSVAGLWLVTPFLALGCAALVVGSGSAAVWPKLLPPDNDERPTTLDGIRYVLIVIVPWLAIFEFTSHMRLPGTAFHFPFEDHLPVYAWTAIIYETSYWTVPFAPVWTRTNRQLRQLTVTSWTAILLVYPIYWFIPSAAPRRPMIDDSWIAHLLVRERTGVAPSAAFPSFHVLWAIFVGRLWPRWMWIGYTAAIAITCISTGMHYIPDVLAAIAIAPLLLEPERRIWRPIGKLAGWVSHAPVAYAAVVALVPLTLAWAAVRSGLELTACAGLAGLVLSLRRGWGRVGSWPLLADVFVAILVLRLWNAGVALPVICGVYLLGTGLALFAESEGSRSRQWVAAAAAAGGAALTALPMPGAFSTAGLWTPMMFALVSMVGAHQAAPAGRDAS